MPVEVSRKVIFYAVLGLLLIATVLTRCHSMNRSLWMDEAWVANSILEPTISETIYYRSWLQTSPPLFLILLRLVVVFFGISNEAFRLVPAVFAITSVFLMVYVACRLLQPFFSLVAVFLFVFCPAVVYYSHEVKQFSSDVFASLTLISFALIYFQKPTRTNLYLWLGSFMVLAFLSYQSLLFIPGMCFVTIANIIREQSWPARGTLRKSKLIDAFVALLCGFVATMIIHFVFIKPNR
jgi:predicted membrane-bound mannosyltransferase